MELAIVLLIIGILEIITPLATKFLKDTLDELKINYPSNVVVLVVAIVLGTAFSLGYMLIAGIDFNILNFFYIICIIAANWVGSMVGYDKVKQTIQQIIQLVIKLRELKNN